MPKLTTSYLGFVRISLDSASGGAFPGERTRAASSALYITIHTHIHLYIYMCVSMCIFA